MINIVVDAMGGDNAPDAVVKGCIKAVEDFNIKITLVGDEEQIKKCLGDYKNENIEIVHTTEVISCDDDPAKSIRYKKDSSIVVGMNLVADGKGDAFVSAGSSGAVVSGATLIVKRIKGIRRVAIGTVIPAKSKPILVLDCGANADCRSEFLEQFAIMGDVYMRGVFGLKAPKVALLNNGAEEHKGGELHQEAFQRIKNLSVDFVGNIEARDILDTEADVVVADGFSGNVFLKTTEGTASYFSSQLKTAFKKNLITKLAAVFMLNSIKEMKKKFDYTEYGGAPILGAKKVVVKAHGSSNDKAIYNAVRQAKSFVENRVCETIDDNMQKLLDE